MDSKDISVAPIVKRGESGVRDGGDQPVSMIPSADQHTDDFTPAKNSGQRSMPDSAFDAMKPAK